MASLRIRPVLIVLLLLVAVLQYELWFEPTGIMKLFHLHSQLQDQVSANEALKARNLEVENNVQALKKGDDTVESRARDELGMVKKGEVYYRIVTKK